MSANIQQVPAVDHNDKFGYALEIGEEIGFCTDTIRYLNDELLFKKDEELAHAYSLAIFRIEMLVSDLGRLAKGEEILYGARVENMAVKQ